MRVTHSLLSGFCPLASLTTAALVERATSTPPFEITRTKIHEVGAGNTTIRFLVHDPDSLTNASAKCTGSWKTGSSGYPQGDYETCGNSSFAWKMQSYTGISNFVLGIEHVYEDPAVGPYPYDEITTFGNANVTEPDIWCSAMGGQGSCEQCANETISAPISATIARRS